MPLFSFIYHFVTGLKHIIMDIGSNFGYYGALAAQRTDKKKSKIIYFEANPHLIPYIHKTLNVNWMNEQSVVENMAVSDKKGNLTLTVLNDYIGSSSLHSIEHMAKFLDNKMELAVNEKIKVKSISIDEYCKDNSMDKVDLIKMDIEGYEEIAYSGMRGIIDKSPETTLLIEFTKNSYKNPKNFYNELMNDFGNIYVINNDGLLVRPKNRTYEAVAGSSDDWIMLVFSKRKGLEKHTN